MDFEIAMLVYKRFTTIGLTDEEVAFLLGKRNKYVFDLLNPTQKDKFKTEQLDILPTIIESTIRNIIPNHIKPDETIKLKAAKKVYASKIVYEYLILHNDNTESNPVTIVKEIKRGERKQIHSQVHHLTLELIQDGYFNEPKNALEIYLYFKKMLTVSFRPSDIQKSLAVCLRNEKGQAVLKQDIVNARYVYKCKYCLCTT